MKTISGLAIVVLMGLCAVSGARVFNYDEAKVGEYQLPPLLLADPGTSISTSEQWMQTRRPHLLELFRQNVYGRSPEISGELKFDVVSSSTEALGGLAERTEVRITLDSVPEWKGINLLLYTPKNARGPVPVVLGLNFYGNHTITSETGVMLSDRWMRDSDKMGIEDHRATEESRGKLTRRWPLQMILERGFAVGTAYCGDIEPDQAEGWKMGLRGMIARDESDAQRSSDDWGAIGAWAWGLSRMLDYCERDDRVDTRRSIVIGHSRLGKTALWAGAQDQRFGLVVSNNSGEGGAALARRDYGETIKIITTSFPHWFCSKFATYAGRADDLPVDQHMLIALMAPRPVYIASATRDRWADPRGEFLSGVNAGPVYELFGLTGLGTDEWPEPDKHIGHLIGYHLREGGHDLTSFDWTQYLDFADKHFSNR